MQVNGVSSAGIALVNRELQQSLWDYNTASAAQRQRSIDANVTRAEAADAARTQVVNQINLNPPPDPVPTGTDTSKVDLYL